MRDAGAALYDALFYKFIAYSDLHGEPVFEVVPPRLSMVSQPHQQRKSLWHVERQLKELGYYVDQVELNIILFDAGDFYISGIRPSKNLPPGTYDPIQVYSAWKRTACRDSAMAMFNFERGMNAIKSSLADVADLLRLVDHQKLKTAEKLFKSYFPDFKGLRHSVGHTAEFFGTKEQRRNHSIKGPINTGVFRSEGSQGTVIIDSIENRKFMSTYNGRLVTLDMSLGTVNKLTEITILFYSGFKEASNYFLSHTTYPV